MEAANSKVRLGNGALVDVKGKGTIGVQTKKDSRFIRGVLYMPDLNQNLLSVGQLVENGYSLHFEDYNCTIFDKEKDKLVLTKLKMKNWSFIIKFKHGDNVAFRIGTTTD